MQLFLVGVDLNFRNGLKTVNNEGKFCDSILKQHVGVDINICGKHIVLVIVGVCKIGHLLQVKDSKDSS